MTYQIINGSPDGPVYVDIIDKNTGEIFDTLFYPEDFFDDCCR